MSLRIYDMEVSEVYDKTKVGRGVFVDDLRRILKERDNWGHDRLQNYFKLRNSISTHSYKMNVLGKIDELADWGEWLHELINELEVKP